MMLVPARPAASWQLAGAPSWRPCYDRVQERQVRQHARQHGELSCTWPGASLRTPANALAPVRISVSQRPAADVVSGAYVRYRAFHSVRRGPLDRAAPRLARARSLARNRTVRPQVSRYTQSRLAQSWFGMVEYALAAPLASPTSTIVQRARGVSKAAEARTVHFRDLATQPNYHGAPDESLLLPTAALLQQRPVPGCIRGSGPRLAVPGSHDRGRYTVTSCSSRPCAVCPALPPSARGRRAEYLLAFTNRRPIPKATKASSQASGVSGSKGRQLRCSLTVPRSVD
ncbi:hypothetical protein C8Q77DRAFT_552352 [Trametes polyzona]|nr:hypothetical protein C8Q77DRAFT_552352 [Trametes polyzona]